MAPSCLKLKVRQTLWGLRMHHVIRGSKSCLLVKFFRTWNFIRLVIFSKMCQISLGSLDWQSCWEGNSVCSDCHQDNDLLSVHMTRSVKHTTKSFVMGEGFTNIKLIFGVWCQQLKSAILAAMETLHYEFSLQISVSEHIDCRWVGLTDAQLSAPTQCKAIWAKILILM